MAGKTAVSEHAAHSEEQACSRGRAKHPKRKYGVRPGWIQGPCRMGCMGTKHTKERAANGTGYTWWDLDNVTRFFHALGHNVTWQQR